MVNLRLAAALALCAGAAVAEDRSVVIANGDYTHFPVMDVSTAAPDALRAAGFRVVSGVDLKAAEIRPALADLLNTDADPGARLVVLSGRFAHSASDSWFFGTDAEAPDLVSADLQGVPLSVVIDLLGQKKGGAMLFLAEAEGKAELGAGLTPGTGEVALPEGVTLVKGTPEAVEAGVNLYLKDGRVSGEGLNVSGWQETRPKPGTTVTPATPQSAEARVWSAARAQDDIAGYRDYLNRYPNGAHADDARARITALTPVNTAAQAETALRLSADQRRAVQRRLVTLGHDTRGVDGQFGPGTRAAITAFQRAHGYEPTGYLSQPMLNRLTALSDARDAEAARADDAFWKDVGEKGGEAGLRAYLERYPKGRHAAEAKRRLDALNPDKPRDDAAFAASQKAGTVAGYRAYLRDWPKGAHVKAANDAIAALEKGQNDAAAKAEAALGLDAQTRQLVEVGLQAMGLNPGPADGKFDDQTRRAIKAYQKARGMPQTGYLTNAMLSTMLQDTLLRGLR